MSLTEPTAPGPIRLEIPAAPQFLATARLVAASAGADAGLSVDDLDDLRLGVDELVAVLIARAANEARILLVVEVRPDRVIVSGEIIGEADTRPDSADELSERIVAAVVDAYQLADRTFGLEKSASTRAR